MVVREQLGPELGDQAIVAINNESPENDFFHPEYAQYAQYAQFTSMTICTICKTICIKYASNMQNIIQNMLNMHAIQVLYAKYAK